MDFPAPTADMPPAWLGMSPEFWVRHRGRWYDQIDKLLNVRSYFEKVFRADQALADAHEEVRTWSAEQLPGQRGFSCLEDAQEWLRRVELWHANLQRDLQMDSVPAPAPDSGRWLLFGPAVMNRCDCWFCHKSRMPELHRELGIVSSR